MAGRLNTSDLLDGLRNFVRNLRLSVIESVFLVAALVFAGIVAFVYLTRIQPKQSAIADLEARIKIAQKKIDDQKEDIEKRKRQIKDREKILGSLDDFESRLKDRTAGMTQMIGEVNQLSRTHHLIFPGITLQPRGSEFQAEPPALTEQTASGNTSASPTPTPLPAKLGKELNLYPSLGMDTSVEGAYRDLRRFIYDLERSRQFLIISSIAFQGVDEKVKQIKERVTPSQIGNLPDPGAVSIALKIQMDAFFQKPEAAKASAESRTNDASSNKNTK